MLDGLYVHLESMKYEAPQSSPSSFSSATLLDAWRNKSSSFALAMAEKPAADPRDNEAGRGVCGGRSAIDSASSGVELNLDVGGARVNQER